jgi:hypothetical protein
VSGAKARCLNGNRSLTTVDEVLYGHAHNFWFPYALLDSDACVILCTIAPDRLSVWFASYVLEYSSRPGWNNRVCSCMHDSTDRCFPVSR